MAKQWIIGTVTVFKPEYSLSEWAATDDNYDGLQDGNNEIGYGTSAWKAWLDLMEKLA